MKKTATTIATLSLLLILIATAVGQDRHRAPQPKGMNKADLTEQLSIRSNRQRNRRPAAISNPIGMGGTVTAGLKNQQGHNLGDTGTHEVGHKGKRRSGAIGEGASEVNARQQQPRKTQNLLPYMEQSNLKRRR